MKLYPKSTFGATNVRAFINRVVKRRKKKAMRNATRKKQRQQKWNF